MSLLNPNIAAIPATVPIMSAPGQELKKFFTCCKDVVVLLKGRGPSTISAEIFP